MCYPGLISTCLWLGQKLFHSDFLNCVASVLSLLCKHSLFKVDHPFPIGLKLKIYLVLDNVNEKEVLHH